jgi:hypothetical protein
MHCGPTNSETTEMIQIQETAGDVIERAYRGT